MGKKKFIDEIGIKSANDQNVNNSSIFDQNDFEKFIEEGKSEDEYLDLYCKLVDNALKRGLRKKDLIGYYEKHHILPKCMNGEDKKYNYVLFTAFEHFIAHIILFRLYPNNKRIAKAVISMFEYSGYTIERKIAIDKVKDAARIREEALRISMKIPVVCFDSNFTVYRIYSSISESKDDNFLSTSSVINGTYTTCRGYYFMKLEEFEKLYPDKLEEFNNLIELPKLNLKPLDRQTELVYNEIGTKVLCLLEENRDICKIYNSKTETELDGFERHRVSESINSNIKTGGYYWKSLDDYKTLNKDKVDDYYNRLNNGYIPTVKAIYNKESKKCPIICYDESGNIMKIYNTIKEARIDGFISYSISRALNNTSSNKYADYYWIKLSDWKDKYKLEEYNNSSILNNSFSRKTTYTQKLIRTDSNNNIIKIYNSIGQVREDGLFHQNVFRVLKQQELAKNKKLYNNSYWYRYSDYEQEYPEKLKDYLDNHKKE